MKSIYSGVVYGGAVQLDEQIELADECRVHVTIVPADQRRAQWQSALSALEELKKLNPIHSGNLRFTREQLHDRG